MSKGLAKTIGTHSGTFHCDEALGCFLLRRTKEFANATITRTRNEQVPANAGTRSYKAPAATYSPTREVQYHRRKRA